MAASTASSLSRPVKSSPAIPRPHSRPSYGFTLIEVMVALTIIAISLGALLNTSGSQASGAGYLKQKTLAHWVAQNEIAALQISKTFPDLGDQKGDTEMAGHRWYWIRTTKATEDKHVRQIAYTVYLDEAYEHNLTRLTGYVSR